MKQSGSMSHHVVLASWDMSYLVPMGSNSVLHFILFSLNMMTPLVLLLGISRCIQNKNSVVRVFVLEMVSSISIMSFSLQYK